jgi:hypothetical protein
MFLFECLPCSHIFQGLDGVYSVRVVDQEEFNVRVRQYWVIVLSFRSPVYIKRDSLQSSYIAVLCLPSGCSKFSICSLSHSDLMSGISHCQVGDRVLLCKCQPIGHKRKAVDMQTS